MGKIWLNEEEMVVTERIIQLWKKNISVGYSYYMLD